MREIGVGEIEGMIGQAGSQSLLPGTVIFVNTPRLAFLPNSEYAVFGRRNTGCEPERPNGRMRAVVGR